MKRRMAAMLTLLLLWGLVPRSAAEGGPEISAKSVVLMERQTGTVLYESDCHKQLEPASVTKVMTMLLVTEAVENRQITLEDMVTVSAEAAGMGGSQVFLEEGEQMPVSDLLKAVAVASGNDAAVALAEYISGSEGSFVDKMNARAKELGMKDTHFCNCTGLPSEGHVTTAYDIALMSQALLSHDLIRDYTGIWMDTLRDGTFSLANTNKLIYYYEGATGLKTGSTSSAGFCISASAYRDGMELIAVVLGSETSAERFDTAKALLNYGFNRYTLLDVTPKTPLPKVAVSLGTAETVALYLEQRCRVLATKEEAEGITTKLIYPEKIEAPVKAGQVLGKVEIYSGEKCIDTVPLTAALDVEKLGFGQLFGRMFRRQTGA